MNSSTSSSDPSARLPSRSWRVWLSIVGLLALVELGARATVLPGTADRGSEFAERARAVAAAPAPRIVFIGNSVTDRVRLDVFANEWQSLTGTRPSLEKFVTYDSNLSTWYRMAAQYFWKPGLKPDLFVITYYEGNQLADSAARDIGNLALYYTDPADRPSLFRSELRTVQQRLEFLLASISHAVATRDRMHDAVLRSLPGYRHYATAINAVNFEYEMRRAAGKPVPPRSYRALTSFLDDARDAGALVCFVASPSRPGRRPRPYIIGAAGRIMIDETGMLDVDLRSMPGLSSDMYSDNVHLNGKGAPVYTRKLAAAINEAWKR